MEFNQLRIRLCDSFDVTASVAFPAVQGIVVTRGILDIQYSAHVLVPALVKKKGNLSRYHF
jgi:hypothetical protein